MKVAIASVGDPFSVSTWSGIPSHIAMALQQRGHEVVGITLKQPVEPWYYDWYRRIYYRLQGKWFLSAVEPYILRKIAGQFDDQVAEIKPDVVLVIHGDFLAYTTFKEPAVIVHDTTFASLLGYYPAFSNLTKRSIRAGNTMYQLALDRAAAAIFSAEWASSSAARDYDVSVSKIFTVPLGANLVNVPSTDCVQGWIRKRAEEDVCNFLFFGVDWERKGGPDALEIVVELNRRGIGARLLIAGCSPIIDPEHEKYVQQMGFLRKDVKEEASQLEQLLICSHALLLPSLAECYGCVYCEANAYGLPAIGRDTGGIPEIIKDGSNGLLMGKNERPELFAEKWLKIWRNPLRYMELSRKSRTEFVQRLNYTVYSEKLENIFKQILK